ncbi:hypothetical protein MMC28_010171 [Mycoblastus sanguinarius]|nr:hypothetical protein [Mycoblastus sanguinarius]
MSSLALDNQRRAWKVTHWTLPGYNVWIFLISSTGRVSPSRLQTRFAVWGLEYGIFHITAYTKFYATDIALFWQDDTQRVGKITIEKIAPNTVDRNSSSTSSTSSLSFSNSTDLNSPEYLNAFADLGENVRVALNYNGARINSGAIFLTAVSAMRECADEGADTRCPSLTVRGWDNCKFVVNSEKDRFGNSLLRYRYVVVLLRKVATSMVANKRFGEMVIVLEVDGAKVAEAAFVKITGPHDSVDALQIER